MAPAHEGVVTELMVAALTYAAKGWPVLPLHTWTGQRCTCDHPDDCGSPAKHPRTRNGLKNASTDTAVIRSWWGRWPDANIGLRTGVAFDALDVDGDEGFAAIQQIEADCGDEPPGPISFTGGGGLHKLFLPTGIGNRAGILDHVDWRGRNGYIVAPPSLHATGNRYEWHPDAGPDGSLEAVNGWLQELLFPPKQDKRTAIPKAQDTTAYSRRAFDAELGELARAGEGTRNNTLNDCAFNLYQLVYGGELSEAEVTQALERVAYGLGLSQREIDATLKSARTGAAQHPRSAPALTVIGNTATKPAAQPEPKAVTDEAPDSTGWEAVDVAQIIAGGCHIEPPALYRRTDRVCLIYAGKLHAFNGEPESGKSWAAQHVCLQALADSLNVCYIDFEDSPESVIGRLLALGATTDDLADRLTYIGPDRPLNDEAMSVLRQRFATHRPHLVIIDGVTEAMSIMGLNPLDNADTAKFFRFLPRGLAKLGAAVILIDHVVKDQEDRGRWAIGAQHKMAALTGAAFTIEIVNPFGRNKTGLARIIVTKDRPGYIRQHAAGGTVAELHIASDDTAVTATLKAPAGIILAFRPTKIMQRVSETLEHGPALTKNQLKGSIKARHEHIDLAIRLLVAEQYVQVVAQGQSHYHSVVKRYREDLDPKTQESDEPF